MFWGAFIFFNVKKHLLYKTGEQKTTGVSEASSLYQLETVDLKFMLRFHTMVAC